MKFFWKYTFPAIYGLVAYFTIRLLTDSISGMKFWHRAFSLNLIEIAVSILTGYVLFAALDRLFRYFDERITQGFSYKVVLSELWYVLIISLLIQNLFLTTMAASTDDGLQWYDVVDINLIPLFYTLIYYGLRRSSTFFKAYIDSRIQVERITNDHLQTELKFLKAQYHPHFLFNALNTIYFQMDEDVAAAKKTVESFSALLRYQLYDAHKKTSVENEIEYLQNFIKIQQLRAVERLKLTTYFDYSLKDETVYPLLFLPLVENAFKYLGGTFELDIKMYKEDNVLIFEVQNSILNAVNQSQKQGIGLENLKRRLELLYPGRYQYSTSTSNNTYATQLKLPLSDELIRH